MSQNVDLLNTPQQLTAVLNMLSQPDTDVVKQGETMLKPLLKDKNCVFALMNQLSPAAPVPIRHHASLLLKKKIGTCYAKFQSDASKQTTIKQQILQFMISDTDKAVRVALAGCVAVLSKNVLAGKDWPELFSLLLVLAQNPDENMRVVNYSLLEQLSEHVSNKLLPHTTTLAQMFVMGCQDPVPAVAAAAMAATANYIRAISSEKEVMELKMVLTPMLTVMHACLLKGDEEIVSDGLEVLTDCVEIEQPLLNDHLEMIVPFIVTILQKEDYGDDVKQSAGTTLTCIVENRPKLLAKKGLVVPTLTALMQLLAKESSSGAGSLFSFSAFESRPPTEEDEDEEDYNPEMDEQRLVQQCIDTMAMSIPSKHFVGPALSLISQGMQSTNPQMRKAGCAVLGVIAEGCCDPIKEKLNEILPALLQAIADPEFYVRECACFALGQFSEYCQPDILYFHQSVLPVIFNALDDPRPTVQSTSCYVLEMFCEGLQPETLRPFLTPLMTRLASLLQSPNRMTQEMALTAIAATSVAAELDFLPYAETICTLLMPLLFNTEPTMFQLRGRAMECLGHVAVAIGKENFARYFDAGMQSACAAIHLNDDVLKEHSYVFFANGVKVMKNDFNRFLPELVPHLLEVIQEDELVLDEDEDEEDDDDDDENDKDVNADGDEDDQVYMRLNVQEGFINSKKAALTAMGALAEHTKEAFQPYLYKTIEAVLTPDTGAIFSQHEYIRGEGIIILKDMITSACASVGITAPPAKGVVIPLPASVSDVCRVSMTACINTIKGDMEKTPVAQACECIIGILTQVGIVALTVNFKDNIAVITPLMEAIHLLLTEKAPCQKSQGKVHDAEDEEDDHDNIVMDAVSDLVGALAKVMGADFVPYFDHFKLPLLKFAKPTRPYTDRSMAIGCFAEVVQEIGPSAMKYTDVVLPLIQLGLSDQMESVRRNSAFCIGVLVESCGNALVPFFMDILQQLHPLCSRRSDQMASDKGGADVDNAISAVARMINISPSSIPLQQVIPAMLAALPLRADNSEGPVIYGCLLQLLHTGNPIALSMKPQIIDSFAKVVVQTNAMPETIELVGNYLKTNP